MSLVEGDRIIGDRCDDLIRAYGRGFLRILRGGLCWDYRRCGVADNRVLEVADSVRLVERDRIIGDRCDDLIRAYGRGFLRILHGVLCQDYRRCGVADNRVLEVADLVRLVERDRIIGDRCDDLIRGYGRRFLRILHGFQNGKMAAALVRDDSKRA